MKRLSKIALVTALFAAGAAASAANVLVVMSDVSQLELKDGKHAPTGFYLNELMQPVKLLIDAGHTLTFVTPLGKAPTMDKGSANKMYFGDDEASMAAHLALLDKLKLTAPDSPVVSLARVEQIGYDKFDAIYVPGGHAPMQDLLKSRALGKLLTSFHEKGKVTAMVCHGPIALLSAMPDADGFVGKLEKGAAGGAKPAWIYADYQMTVFSNKEEEASKAQLGGGTMKFYPETALVKAGGVYAASPALWNAKVVIDRELITGQNPASAVGVGQAMLQRLK